MSAATEAFEQGQLVAMPTETVYGLAAPIDKPDLIQKIFTLKERPFFDPLIVHVSSLEQAKSLSSDWSDLTQRLAEHFWPGPLTLVVKKNPKWVSDMITSGLDTVGLRFPKHEMAQKFIKELGVAVAAPSANKFGKTSPTTIEHVKAEFDPKDVYFMDGGPCNVGIESTIVGVDQNVVTILRAGLISETEIQSLLKSNEVLKHHSSHEIVAPGQVKHHYMPNVPVIFFRVQPNSKLLKMAFEKLSLPTTSEAVSLDLPQRPELAARALYSSMRDKAKQADVLYCYIEASKDQDPKWQGIIDRLNKASQIKITEADQS